VFGLARQPHIQAKTLTACARALMVVTMNEPATSAPKTRQAEYNAAHRRGVAKRLDQVLERLDDVQVAIRELAQKRVAGCQRDRAWAQAGATTLMRKTIELRQRELKHRNAVADMTRTWSKGRRLAGHADRR
jgi:hypothetical protein